MAVSSGCLLVVVTAAMTLTVQAQVAAPSYSLIGVSGGLQEGFPAHEKLHYHYHDSNNKKSVVVKALFLGRGLVRGYKAFLDLMEPSWREYTDEKVDQSPPVINSNVFASGCHEHANEYWLYLVDSRHTLSILNNEPRFLSMTPDTGMVELNAINGTSPLVRKFLKAQLQEERTSTSTRKAITHVAIPLVTCVYFQESSHIPSPTFYTIDEGSTEVTNFPDSLALWAQVNDSDRTAVLDTTKRCKTENNSKNKQERKMMESDCGPSVWAQAVKSEQRYWQGIRQAIRYAEAHRPSKETVRKYAPPFRCRRTVRFGVGKDDDPENTSTRVNYPFTAEHMTTILHKIGFRPNYERGEILPLDSSWDTDRAGSDNGAPDL